MDLEELIKAAAKDKADRLEVALPSFDETWKKAQRQKKFTNEKTPNSNVITNKYYQVNKFSTEPYSSLKHAGNSSNTS